jgi:hypothetical protein
VLSIKLIYLELLISHFIRPVENAELLNVTRVSKSLETPAIQHYKTLHDRFHLRISHRLHSRIIDGKGIASTNVT